MLRMETTRRRCRRTKRDFCSLPFRCSNRNHRDDHDRQKNVATVVVVVISRRRCIIDAALLASRPVVDGTILSKELL